MFVSSFVVWFAPWLFLIVVAFRYAILPVLGVNLILSLTDSPEVIRELVAVVGIGVVFLFTLKATADRVAEPIEALSLRLSPLPLGRRVKSPLGLSTLLSWIFSSALLVAYFLRVGSPIPFAASLLCFLAYSAVALRSCVILRRQWHGWPPSDSVLFLRTFGGTAERLLVSGLLEAGRRIGGLVVPIGVRQAVALWDPLIIGIEGASTTYYVRAPRDWQPAIRRLIGDSRAVVIDSSDGSRGVDEEMRMVQSCKAQAKTVVARRRRRHDQDLAEGDARVQGFGRLFLYTGQWPWPPWRWIAGTVSLGLVSIFVMPENTMWWLHVLEVAAVAGVLFLRPSMRDEDGHKLIGLLRRHTS